jgi:predicted lipid-binding transport protein (Tim44 family)
MGFYLIGVSRLSVVTGSFGLLATLLFLTCIALLARLVVIIVAPCHNSSIYPCITFK